MQTAGRFTLLDQRAQLRAEHNRLRDRTTHDLPLIRELDNHDRQHAKAQRTLTALDTWADWANGHSLRPAQLINTAHHLHHTGGHHTLLAQPLTDWIHEQGLAAPYRSAPQRTTPQPTQTRDSPGLDIGL